MKYKRREQVKTIIGYDNKMKHINCPRKIKKKNLQDQVKDKIELYAASKRHT